MKRLVYILIILALLITAACGSSAEPTATAPAPTDPPRPTETPAPTVTLEPTATPEPTDTPAPTATPEPTNTPMATATATATPEPPATPEPLVLSGSGDSIVDVERPDTPALIHITGNDAGQHFAVMSYDSEGERIELLVNVTDPYDGICPLDFMSGEHTTRLEISATGEWRVEILPLTAARTLTVPGSIEGEGDDVLWLVGATPDLATIVGNAGGHYFGAWAYGDGRDMLVNTTDPYEGTVILSSDATLLALQATGAWNVTVTGK